MYFEAEVVPPRIKTRVPNPGVAVAWFGIATDMPLTINNLGLIIDLRRAPPTLDEIADFLEASVFNFERTTGPSNTRAEGGERRFASYILDQPIVIERSPPLSIPLHSLLTKAPGVAIGTFVGIEAAASHPLLMLATVPGGIIAVSSAIGISRALEAGLNKAVDRMIKRLK